MIKLFVFLLIASTLVEANVIFTTDFETNAGGFAYSDNTFRGVVNGKYASGRSVGGAVGTASFVEVTLGGIDTVSIRNGISGGWSRNFVLSRPSSVSIEINYQLTFNANYEPDEFAQVLCSVDGILIGLNSKDFIVQVTGDGNGGLDNVVGYTTVTLTSSILATGTHRITVGGYNNQKTWSDELTRVRFSKVSVTATPTPTRAPTKAPVKLPTRIPTKSPTKLPIKAPTRAPIRIPTKAPTKRPTNAPTKIPTTAPIRAPTKAPIKVTAAPTRRPTRAPTVAPTKRPTQVPTKIPIKLPTKTPTTSPTKLPTLAPTKLPTSAPIKAPITNNVAFSIRISSGSAIDLFDSSGQIWEKDQFFGNKGGVYSVCPLSIANTTFPSLYCKERYFNIWQHAQPFRYDVPVPRAGAYTVKLHFAETYHKTVGQRIFDVWIGGLLYIAGLDIVAEVGYDTALVTSTVVQVTSPLVSIEFVAKTENPKICGIEVIEVSNYVPPPTRAPVTQAPVAPAPFDNILINCGGDAYVESSGVRTWVADRYFIGGSTYSDGSNTVAQTEDDWLYQSERNGEFRYEIPVPVGSYEVVLHFTELYWQGVGQRLFDILVEDTISFKNVDMVKLGGGSRLQAFTLETPVTVIDGFVSIAFSNSNPKIDNPSVAAIEVNFLEPHLAHSVANGPYIATDVSNIGQSDVKVDGSFSHSHATGAEVVEWKWKIGATIVGVGSTPTLTLPVGNHVVTLTIKDNLGNEATDTATITVNPFGYPAITNINPLIGSVAGGEKITIYGSGFNHLSSQVKVFLGWVEMSGASLTIVDQFTIELIAPATTVAAPVAIKVQTPVGTSNSMAYSYQTSSPINFNSDVLTREIASPTSAAFGPDGFLYVGTLFGTLARIKLDGSYTQVVSSITSNVAPFRAILGIAFDPLQTSGLSDVFITTSFFFHGSPLSSGGQAMNGNVKKVSGANLDIITDIVTGLPVSDHDHGTFQKFRLLHHQRVQLFNAASRSIAFLVF